MHLHVPVHAHIHTTHTHTCTCTYTQHRTHCSNKPTNVSSFCIFSPSFCIFGKPSAAMAILQYSLKAATSALRCKCSNRISFASLVSAVSIFEIRPSEITSLRFSQSRLSLGLTTSKNSSSCFFSTCDAAQKGHTAQATPTTSRALAKVTYYQWNIGEIYYL